MCVEGLMYHLDAQVGATIQQCCKHFVYHADTKTFTTYIRLYTCIQALLSVCVYVRAIAYMNACAALHFDLWLAAFVRWWKCYYPQLYYKNPAPLALLSYWSGNQQALGLRLQFQAHIIILVNVTFKWSIVKINNNSSSRMRHVEITCTETPTHRHTFTYVYAFIFTFISTTCVCVCVCVTHLLMFALPLTQQLEWVS